MTKQEEMKKRFEKEFNSLFGVNVSILNSEPVMIGNPPIADILAFIQSEINLALANRNKELVKKIEKAQGYTLVLPEIDPAFGELTSEDIECVEAEKGQILFKKNIINLITKDNE